MKKPEKVLLLGSGGLRISQAGEFDYSGSQAIKALKEEGIRVILVNPNIATIQTDPDMADDVYLQPLSLEKVTEIIEKERPDAILLGFGGQTALNLGLKLEEAGVLEKYQVRVLGTSTAAIRLSEDRALFKAELDKMGIHSANSFGVTSLAEALVAAEKVGYPLMMRSGFSLGGLGSGIIYTEKELKKRVTETLSIAPQILIEENLIGWSEFEYEIVRDCAGNSLTICNMENFDPMGIHTGESIVVSPSQSLNNEEYHRLRSIAITVANHFEIVGECNIQYAFNLKTSEYRVIEINPRLSRSSALASKATGYPLAFVAAKLALGYKLFELKNSITKKTCAFFEPALDYVVVKIPRWDTHKLKGAERRIGTEMKSVGEVMAIGRSFPEALQKAVGMLNIGASCLADYPKAIQNPLEDIQFATDRRIYALYQFFYQGGALEQAHQLSQIDPWFLHHIQKISQFARDFPALPLTPSTIRTAKQLGFSDKVLGRWKQISESEFRKARLSLGIFPVTKQIDTLAGEFDAQTNYLYMTYHGVTHDIKPSRDPMTLILGSGPYSIGSSVEFDWSSVTASRTLRRLGQKTIFINSNPETVSTDYDESDRLYFEQLTFERVQDIADFEHPQGLIVSVGGQIANNLVTRLADQGYPILGTSADHIAQAENRERFSQMLNQLGVDQPAWITADSLDAAKAFAHRVGYPVLIRPSFVLSGAAMNVVASEDELEAYLQLATEVSPDHPVVISDFITDAKELEMDGVAENGKIIIYAMSEHIENAGVHSGDATIVTPPQRLYLETIRRTKKITKKIVKALNITGPFNIQLIAKNNAIQVIECNLRASRSFPFVSKVTGHNFIEIATLVLMGQHMPTQYNTLDLDYVGVKFPQFSYSRLKGADPVAHVEMASTGEVACLGEDLKDAFYRAWQASEQIVRRKKIFISIGGDKKPKLLEEISALAQQGWEIFTTRGTYLYLADKGIQTTSVFKVSEQLQPDTSGLIMGQKIDLIINIPKGSPIQASQNLLAEVSDGFHIRRLAIDHHIPLITNLQLAQLALQCLAELHASQPRVKSWREFVNPL